MTFEELRYEVADGIATITLNRPERLNALDYALRDEVLKALETAAQDEAVRVLTLTGAGRAFCAGADMQEVLLRGLDMDPNTRERREVRDFNAVVLAMRHLEKPIIATEGL
jgi:2-(1,2-epoxy-1,2-dihydrophenyl)acetyl-CoA isomerase